jgi:hypothetical protein
MGPPKSCPNATPALLSFGRPSVQMGHLQPSLSDRLFVREEAKVTGEQASEQASKLGIYVNWNRRRRSLSLSLHG